MLVDLHLLDMVWVLVWKLVTGRAHLQIWEVDLKSDREVCQKLCQPFIPRWFLLVAQRSLSGMPVGRDSAYTSTPQNPNVFNRGAGFY